MTTEEEQKSKQELEPELSSYELLMESKMDFHVIDKQRQQAVNYSALLRDLYARIMVLEEKANKKD